MVTTASEHNNDDDDDDKVQNIYAYDNFIKVYSIVYFRVCFVCNLYITIP